MDGARKTMTAGGAIFQRLKALGVDYVFANSGTDFPPIIEGLAEAADEGVDLPRAVVIPHEHAAMGMAHGYYLMSGRPQAVMLHTNVGLANGVIGAINAACEHIPVLMMSGRTPVMEGGRFGARTVPIGWGQEMRDQAALIRESVKFDYELRFPEQVQPMLDRAWAIAMSTPRGPVYLSLPREVLCETIDPAGLSDGPAMQPARIAPDPRALAAAAEILADAERPLIIAQRGAGDAASFAAFADWVSDRAIPVASWWATHLAIDTDHPCHIGADPGAYMAEADAVVILDCLAPWWPDRHALHPDARVINIGPDPLFSRFPARTFPSDVTIQGESADVIPALVAAMAGFRAMRPRLRIGGPASRTTRRRSGRGWPRPHPPATPPAFPSRGSAAVCPRRWRGSHLRSFPSSARSWGNWKGAGTGPGSRNRIPAASAGRFPPRWGRSSPRRSGPSSRRWGTDPTCSRTPRPATRWQRHWASASS
jgi:acetolactate synthase-1/2/3 large subunit